MIMDTPTRILYDGEEVVRANMLEKSGVGKRYLNMRLNEFHPSNEQLEAYEAAVKFCDEFVSGKNRGGGLLFAGNCGSGKTMLAAAVCGEVISRIQLNSTQVDLATMFGVSLETYGVQAVKFVNAVDLLERLRCSYSTGNAYEILNEYRTAPLLVLDDLGAQKSTGWSGERLYDLINYRYMELLPIIITTNCRVEELRSAIGDRTFDRLRAICRYIPITTAQSLRTGKRQGGEPPRADTRFLSTVI